jgi:hypothetical protein
LSAKFPKSVLDIRWNACEKQHEPLIASTNREKTNQNYRDEGTKNGNKNGSNTNSTSCQNYSAASATSTAAAITASSSSSKAVGGAAYVYADDVDDGGTIKADKKALRVADALSVRVRNEFDFEGDDDGDYDEEKDDSRRKTDHVTVEGKNNRGIADSTTKPYMRTGDSSASGGDMTEDEGDEVEKEVEMLEEDDVKDVINLYNRPSSIVRKRIRFLNYLIIFDHAASMRRGPALPQALPKALSQTLHDTPGALPHHYKGGGGGSDDNNSGLEVRFLYAYLQRQRRTLRRLIHRVVTEGGTFPSIRLVVCS